MSGGGIERRGLFRGAATLGAAAALPSGLAQAQNTGQNQAKPPPASAQSQASTTSPAPGTVAAWRAGARSPADRPPVPPYRFLNATEAAFVEAAVDRLIPDDDDWPGALWAGVPSYIDGQLAGAYGQGARLYSAGPWMKGTPSQGYQLAMNPSQLYRISLAALQKELDRRKLDFATAAPDARDDFLRELEAGKVDCGGFSSDVFFETLLGNTIEGYLSDPVYGGNRDMVGWRMIGFPGAYAAYLELYTHHGMKFEREPMSIGQMATAHGHDQGGQRHG